MNEPNPKPVEQSSTTDTTFGKRIFRWMLGYLVVLTMAVALQGWIVNEYVESLVWESTMNAEMDRFIARSGAAQHVSWNDASDLMLYEDGSNKPLPPELEKLPPGLHDEVRMGNGEWAVLIRESAGHRHALMTDIKRMESDEIRFTTLLLLPAAILLLTLGITTSWSVRRLVRPLQSLSDQVAGLRPEQPRQRIELDPGGGSDLLVIGEVLNDFLGKNVQFIERERTFVHSASHELRTPIAIMGGAAEAALEQPDLPPLVQGQLRRIHQTAKETEQLITLLLVLAKDPQRLAKMHDVVRLDELLVDIIDDHHHLIQDRDLRFEITALARCRITAPIQVVQIAIGNLLRNAVENCDRGVIQVSLTEDGTVYIDDPGHGMSPEEISRLYAQVVRSGRHGGGIGLELIARLCEHLNWQLDFVTNPSGGTRTALQVGSSRLSSER